MVRMPLRSCWQQRGRGRAAAMPSAAGGRGDACGWRNPGKGQLSATPSSSARLVLLGEKKNQRFLSIGKEGSVWSDRHLLTSQARSASFFSCSCAGR